MSCPRPFLLEYVCEQNRNRDIFPTFEFVCVRAIFCQSIKKQKRFAKIKPQTKKYSLTSIAQVNRFWRADLSFPPEMPNKPECGRQFCEMNIFVGNIFTYIFSISFFRRITIFARSLQVTLENCSNYCKFQLDARQIFQCNAFFSRSALSFRKKNTNKPTKPFASD